MTPKEAKPAPKAESPLPRRQLQELYLHLDRTGPAGNMYLAWYGQLRAEEKSHAEALEATIEHFYLRGQDWYRLRMERHGTETP